MRERDVAVGPGEIRDAQHAGVDQADQREEADEHDGDVEGKLPAVDGSAGNRADKVFAGVLFTRRHGDGAGRGWDFGLGHQHFGDQDGPGSGHDDGRQEVFGVDAEADVSGHDAARDVGHAGGHDGHQLGAGGAVEEWADGERGFGLSHEDAGRDVGAFGAACAHGALHDPGDDLNDLLHDSDVVEDGQECRNEDDGRKDGEGENAEDAVGVAEWTEDHDGTVGRVAQHAGDGVGAGLEDLLAVSPLDDKDGEDDLEAEAPGDGSPTDRATVG